MGLKPGDRLGPYEVIGSLGAGGMGEVYRARDTRLQREVAVKILPDAFAADPDRRARFEREAQLLAALHHPNIASIFGLEESGGQHALILELVEGPTLAERIAQGPLAFDDALPIAAQIALALEAAHDKGIVHRDLKPANIKLAGDGTVKVLDFGLAKALEPTTAAGSASVSMSPTVVGGLTQAAAGVVLGTAPYMAPEQARGRAVDRRVDIWAFGCVLYEMLTGRPAFPGDDAADVLARVLQREPDWNALPASTPAHVRAVMQRCLQKDPARRVHHVADARLALEEAPVPFAAPAAPRGRVAWWLAGAAAIVAAIAAAAAMRAYMSSTRPALPLRAFVIPTAGFNSSAQTAISADGRWLAYAPSKDAAPFPLYLRALDSFDVREVTTTRSTQINPFFSPDGRWLGFFTEAGLMRVAVSGGSPQLIAPFESNAIESGSWGPDGTIVVSGLIVEKGISRTGLVRVASTGGAVMPLTSPEVGLTENEPTILPDGRTVLFTSSTAQGAAIAAVPISGGTPRIVLRDARKPQYASDTGHLLFQRFQSDDVFAVRMDLSTLAISSEPVRVTGAARVVDYAAFAISQEGTLIYSAAADTAADYRYRVVSVDRAGVERTIVDEPGSWSQPRMSPDGRFVLLRVIGAGATSLCGLLMVDIGRGTRTRVTFEGDNHDPIWHPSGREITWSTAVGNVRHVRAARADGSEVRDLTAGQFERSPGSWSGDGRHLVFTEQHAETDADLWTLSQGTEPRPFLSTRFREHQPAFSPDGRWIAYVSNDSGREEVFARPFAEPTPTGASSAEGARLQISVRGGVGPLWSRDGRELFYAEGEQLMGVTVESTAPLQVSRPRVLMRGPYIWERPGNYDITPDDKQFLFLRRAEGAMPTATLRVIQNWPALLSRSAQ